MIWLRTIGFLAATGIGGTVVIAAGLAVALASEQLLERIPLVGTLLKSVRQAVAAVLIAVGVGLVGMAAGYVHRGTLAKVEIADLQAAHQKALDDIRLQQQVLMSETLKAAKEQADANAAVLKTKLDELQKQADADVAFAADARKALMGLELKDPAAAHAAAPPLILRAIRGR